MRSFLIVLTVFASTTPALAKAKDLGIFGVVGTSGPHQVENTTACLQVNFHFATLRNGLHDAKESIKRKYPGSPVELLVDRVNQRMKKFSEEQCTNYPALSAAPDWRLAAGRACNVSCKEEVDRFGYPPLLAFGLRQLRAEGLSQCERACSLASVSLNSAWKEVDRKNKAAAHAACAVKLTAFRSELAHPEKIVVSPAWIAELDGIARGTAVAVTVPHKDPRMEHYRRTLEAQDLSRALPDCQHQLGEVQTALESASKDPAHADATLVKQLQDALASKSRWYERAFRAR